MESKPGKQFIVTEELFASHAQRIFNLLIDTFMQIGLYIITLSFILVIAESNGNKDFQNYILNNTIAQYTFTICIQLIYYNFFEITFSRTIGKLFTQTIVVDENGELPDHQTILTRTICRLIPFEIFSFLGFPPRGWHDSISKTYVVNKKILIEKKQQFNSLSKSESSI